MLKFLFECFLIVANNRFWMYFDANIGRIEINAVFDTE